MSEHLFNLRAARDDDGNLILSDWLKSFRDSEFAKHMANPVYFSGHQELVKKVLLRSAVICAVDPNDPNHVFGWICIETRGLTQIVHYIYVKKSFRGFGIARKLMTLVETNPFFYTHKTESSPSIFKGGLYNVYLFVGE